MRRLLRFCHSSRLVLTLAALYYVLRSKLRIDSFASAITCPDMYQLHRWPRHHWQRVRAADN